MISLREKYSDLMEGKSNVREFWSEESQGNFFGVLMLLKENEDSLQLMDIEREVITRLLSVIPVRLNELETSQALGNGEESRRIEVDLRVELNKAMGILDRFFRRQLSRYSDNKEDLAKPAS